MLLLQADVTANTAEHKALLKRFHLFGPPGIIFFDAQGARAEGAARDRLPERRALPEDAGTRGRALMLGHVRGIDHAMILVRDLDRARDTYARMGFTLTPRGVHSLGSQNHCIMFGRDYLELMALPASPPAAYHFYADFLAKGEGVGALALATDDAAAAYAELTQAGIAADPPLALSRPVEDLGEARFTLVQLPPAETPGFRTFVCQHHTRDIVWRPEYQRHRERRCRDQFGNDRDARFRALCPSAGGSPGNVCGGEHAGGRRPFAFASTTGKLRPIA